MDAPLPEWSRSPSGKTRPTTKALRSGAITHATDHDLVDLLAGLEEATRKTTFWRAHTAGWRLVPLAPPLELALTPGRRQLLVDRAPPRDRRGIRAMEHESLGLRHRRSAAATATQEQRLAGCVFCDPIPPDTHALAWRDLVIRPNRYPYVDARGMHLLLTTPHHAPQGFCARQFATLLSLQTALAPKLRRTLHYHGICGNSEAHFHWHLTDVDLPLDRALRRGELQRTPVHEWQGGRVTSYDHGLLKGFLVTGGARGVVAATETILEALTGDPRSRGRYNLIVFPPGHEGLRVAVVPRSITAPGAPELGAFPLAGRFMLNEERHDPGRVEQTIAEGLRQVIPPATIDIIW